MDSQRNILLIALLAVSFLLFQQWQKDKNPTPQAIEQAQSSNTVMAPSNADEFDPLPVQQQAAAKTITVTTDVLTLSINTFGGDIVHADLNQYAAEMGSSDPFVLLKNTKGHQFIAQSGLMGPQGIDKSTTNRPNYNVSADSFTLVDGQNELRIPMTVNVNGIDYTKTFVLERGSYAVKVEYDVVNNSGSNATVRMYAYLRQNLMDDGGSITMPTYRGGAYSTQDVRYKKYSFEDFEDLKPSDKQVNLATLTNGEGWAAMIQHYFAAAWVPKSEPGTELFTRRNTEPGTENTGDIGFRMPETTIASGEQANFKAALWVGPKLQSQMEAVAPNLDLVVDYGWLWFIAKPLHWLLSFIHGFVGNWGFAIILLTFVVRGAMYPLTKAQYTSMAKMRMLQPKLQEMRERFGEDRQRMSQEMMELYKKEKVNPLGGCLPLVLQMPIFIALYWALMESVELRHAPFMLWIHDLSSPDPYYVLPLLMGVSMFIIQKMSPTNVTDPMQQKIMTFMPVMFTVFFLWFPAGLVLYWLVSNIVTLIQQTIIYKSLEKKGLHTK